MTIKFIATIVIALLNIFLGIFIYKRNSQNPGNINFAAMCVSGGLWAVFMAFLYFIDSNQILNYMLKGTYAFAIFVPLFYLLFAYHYPYRLWNYPPFLIRAIIAITLILEICFLSGFLN
ncbi:MAG: histidine kinase N-terminal 7TM domain-containing protein, partial [Candidatus Komeilibacteria bacterium]|nr:histidine kinase N-terminal 7TM domain-containing protein [Candidatus Komeilibacteria bacterium]